MRSLCPGDLVELDTVVHDPLRLAVLVALVGAGGRMTVRDLETATGVSLDRSWKRIRPLMRAGLIRSSSLRPRSSRPIDLRMVTITPAARPRIDAWLGLITAAAALLRG